MRTLSLLALGFLCWLTCGFSAWAGEAPPRIWSGLVLATNHANPALPPDHLKRVAGKLQNIFGYNQFEIVGESSEKVGPDSNERWLVPSKDFYMSVVSKPAEGGVHPMKIVLFQNKKRLAELETHISPDSPLFIRGPLYAGGQLLIVLREADPGEAAEYNAPPPPVVIEPRSPLLYENRGPFLPPPPFAIYPGARGFGGPIYRGRDLQLPGRELPPLRYRAITPYPFNGPLYLVPPGLERDRLYPAGPIRRERIDLY